MSRSILVWTLKWLLSSAVLASFCPGTPARFPRIVDTQVDTGSSRPTRRTKPGITSVSLEMTARYGARQAGGLRLDQDKGEALVM